VYTIPHTIYTHLHVHARVLNDMARGNWGVALGSGVFVAASGRAHAPGQAIPLSCRVNIVNDFLKHEATGGDRDSPDYLGAAPHTALAVRYHCSESSTRRFVHRFERCADYYGGDTSHCILALVPKDAAGPRTETSDTDVDFFLRVAIRRFPLLELIEVQDLVQEVCGVSRSIASLCRDFQRLVGPVARCMTYEYAAPPSSHTHRSSLLLPPQNLTVKKVERLIQDRLRHDIQDYIEHEYFPLFRRLRIWRRNRYFDEANFQGRHLGRNRGRSTRGTRLYMERLNASRRSVTLMGLTGACDGVSPFMGVVIEGGARAADLLAFWERDDIIDSIRPGDLVLWDNCRTHHHADVFRYMEQMLHSRGAALVYLPQYYPQYNPIELAFQWIKHRLSHACNRGDFLHLLACIQGRINRMSTALVQSFYDKSLHEMQRDGL